MLNRLFIAIGVLVILAIAAAFVVPRFIQWGDYRGRLETMAAQAFGTEVAIAGDIQLTLLPQPKIEFTGVRVGPEAAPTMEVGKVEAEFSLFDFLRDQYRVTKLQLEQPVINLAIGADGSLISGLVLAEGAEQTNASIANALVVDGTIRVADARSDKVYAADAINGELRLDALNGPFTFQGNASLSGAAYRVRVSTGKIGEDGATPLSMFVGADDQSFVLDIVGTLAGGQAPKYVADLSYRRPPPRPGEGETLDAGRGDLLLEGKLEATSDRLLLASYTLTPDENRAATRLTGAAELLVGKEVSFNAVASGGVIALPPRDATKEVGDPPYELVRLLAEIPLPPIPPVAGKVGLDIAEINLRGASLRNVRIDARTDARSWAVDSFKGMLPGDTAVDLSGTLSVVDGHSIFAGDLTLDSKRLDVLAQLWRKPPPGNPLFNMPGTLAAKVGLSPELLTLNAGVLTVDGINHGVDGRIGLRMPRELSFNAHLTTLGAEESAAMAALLPDVAGNDSFGATFQKGEFAISASRSILFGLDGTDLTVAGTWDGGVLQLSRLSAADLGGASFDLKATAFGTLAKPELSGSGRVKIADGAPVVTHLLTGLGTPVDIQDFLLRSLPADLTLQLDAPAGDSSQKLMVTGRLGTADAALEARLTAGIANALTAPITAELKLSSPSPALMTAQLGLGDQPLFDDRSPLQLEVTVDGAPSASYQTHVLLSGGDDHVGYDGNVVPGDFTAIKGDGDIDVALADPAALVAVLGGGGVYVPPVSGKARLQFDGLDKLTLSDIRGEGIGGQLALTRLEDRATVSGSIQLATIDVRAFLPMLAGAAGTVTGDGVWPEGPLDIGAEPRATQGRVDVTADALTIDGAPFGTATRFGFDWDAQGIHLRNAMASIGAGTINVDATICCASAKLPAKQLSGRIAIAHVPVDAIVPPAVGAGLDGTLNAAAEFDGTGATLSEAVAAMTGTGSYTLTGFSAAHFDPGMFVSAASLQGIVDMEPEALSATVSESLSRGSFDAPSVTGSFTIAGGVLRSPNLAIDGQGARIFGGASLTLPTLSVAARYAMTPSQPADPATALDPTSTEVAAVISGPIWAPVASYDVTTLVDGMKIKASEIELARLEKLQAEDEERQRLAAEERARVAAAQAAAEALRKAAEEEAARLAAEAAAQTAAEVAAAKKAAEDAARAEASQPPMDLGL